MRNKVHLNSGDTDRQIFEKMTNEDLWLDAQVIPTFLYLIEHERCCIPPSWRDVMMAYYEEVKQWVL